MKITTLLLCLYVCCSVSCSDSSSEDINLPDIPDMQQLYFPPINSNSWESTTIQDLNWNIDEEQQLYDFLEEKGTKAFIILKKGRIVIEKYFNNTSSTDKHPWYSAGKTLTAFITGIAKQEGIVDINTSSSVYLGDGWSTLSLDQERTITIRNHLTMTTGLDYTVTNQNCTDTDCLTYLNPSGSFWFYHNAPYTMITNIIEAASNQEYNDYFSAKIKNRIGMEGSWIRLGYTNIYYSTARSMARFGLLNLNKGTWNTTSILSDTDYFNEMITTSQQHNESYGYLWWLNGKNSYRVPSFDIEFPGKLIPNAPDDLIAGLGKNDQKLYVIPSQDLVIVRMGDDTGQALLGPSSFDNDLWDRINALIN